MVWRANRPSPIHSARSSCSSARSGFSAHKSNARRGSMGEFRASPSMGLSTVHMPSVQHLGSMGVGSSTVSKQTSKFAADPDLFAHLKHRVKAEESYGSGSKENTYRSTTKVSPSERNNKMRRHSIADTPSVTASRRNSRQMHEYRPNDFSRPPSGSESPQPQSPFTPPVGQAYPTLAVSNENQYRLIPKEEDDLEEAQRPAKKRQTVTTRRVSKSHLEALPLWRIKGQEALQSLCFQTIMAALIIGNALVIGLETDIKDFEYWDMIENAFLACFFLELVFKAIVVGCYELYDKESPDFNWNVFDTFIVSLGVVDFTVGLFTAKTSGGLATLFRIIRLLRILRIIRIVKFLKQLYLLAFGLAEAAQAVFWVTILMTFILYVCAIVMVKTVGRPPEADPNQEFLNYHFGGVLPSMLTLFVLMSSPNLPIYQDQAGLLEDRPLLALFLVVFIVFGSFGMIALLTGVISESMFEKNDMRKEEERVEHEKLRTDMGVRCEDLYESFYKNEEGEVDIEDIKQEDVVDDMAKTFETVGVFVTEYDLKTMIDYLDVDGSRTINKDEFVRGMLVLAEGLRPITIQEVHYDVGVCKVKIERIEESIKQMVDKVCGIEAEGRVAPPPSTAASSTNSPSPPQPESLSRVGFEQVAELVQDLALNQKEMHKSFQDLGVQVHDLARHRQVQSPLGEDLAALKAYFTASLQELGQHIINQCCPSPLAKERSYSSSRWSDTKFGGPMETRSQASCTLTTTTREPSPRGGHEPTWPSLTFSAAGSSAEQANGEAASVASLSTSAPRHRSVDDRAERDKFFTFDMEQMSLPSRLHPDAARAPGELADVVQQAAAATSTEPAASSPKGSLGSVVQAGEVSNMTPNLMEGVPDSRVTSRSVVTDTQSSSADVASQVQELINWQRRIEAELHRVTLLTQQESAARPAQPVRPLQLSTMAPIPASPSTQSSPPTSQATIATLSPSHAQHASQASPSQAAHGAQVSPPNAANGMQVSQSARTVQPPPGFGLFARAASEPAWHVNPVSSSTSADDAASMAELLSRMRAIVSTHEAHQRLSVNVSAGGDTTRSNEVLEYEHDDGEPLGVPGT